MNAPPPFHLWSHNRAMHLWLGLKSGPVRVRVRIKVGIRVSMVRVRVDMVRNMG